MAQQSGLQALCAAVFGKLNVSAITSALSCGVYDRVPSGSALPYISIIGASEQRFDCMTRAGKECLVQVHIYTAADGFKTGQTILSKVIELLHYVSMTVTGHDGVECQFDNAIDAGSEDVAGFPYTHHVATFRVWMQQTP